MHVLISGGGPVGFITALALAKSGMQITLVEAAPGI
ncbi:MAG: FAD-dependent monooxygenase, partial [Hyphomonas sp.]